jgi:hypothetical protein
VVAHESSDCSLCTLSCDDCLQLTLSKGPVLLKFPFSSTSLPYIAFSSRIAHFLSQLNFATRFIVIAYEVSSKNSRSEPVNAFSEPPSTNIIFQLSFLEISTEANRESVFSLTWVTGGNIVSTQRFSFTLRGNLNSLQFISLHCLNLPCQLPSRNILHNRSNVPFTRIRIAKGQGVPSRYGMSRVSMSYHSVTDSADIHGRYFINNNDEIRNIDNPRAYFNYFLTKSDRCNNLHREAMDSECPFDLPFTSSSAHCH